jgi:2-dehydropantoate 2-reductase
MTQKKILILGAGCVGMAYGAVLDHSDHDVSYLMRSQYEKIKSQKFYSLDMNSQCLEKIFTEKVYKDYLELKNKIFDIIIVSLKTTENKLLKTILPVLSDKKTIVVMLQNGIDNEEYISDFVPSDRIVCAVTTIGALKINQGSILIRFIGEMKLACFNEEGKSARNIVAECFSSKKPFDANVHCYDSHREIRWKKIMWNAVFNPLSIIHNQSADILASHEDYLIEVMAIMDEIKTLAEKENVTITQDEIDTLLTNTRLYTGYFPSMYKDYINGKPIEMEFLINTVIAIAKRHDFEPIHLNSVRKRLNTILDSAN